MLMFDVKALKLSALMDAERLDRGDFLAQDYHSYSKIAGTSYGTYLMMYLVVQMIFFNESCLKAPIATTNSCLTLCRLR